MPYVCKSVPPFSPSLPTQPSPTLLNPSFQSQDQLPVSQGPSVLRLVLHVVSLHLPITFLPTLLLCSPPLNPSLPPLLFYSIHKKGSWTFHKQLNSPRTTQSINFFLSQSRKFLGYERKEWSALLHVLFGGFTEEVSHWLAGIYCTWMPI